MLLFINHNYNIINPIISPINYYILMYIVNRRNIIY